LRGVGQGVDAAEELFLLVGGALRYLVGRQMES
jgi:hypothetical protein